MSYRPTTIINCAKCGKKMKVYDTSEPNRWCWPCITRNLKAQDLLRRAKEKAECDTANQPESDATDADTPTTLGKPTKTDARSSSQTA